MSSKLPLSDALKRLAANEEKFEGIVNGVEGHEEELGGKKTPSLRTLFSQLTSKAFADECVQRACACAKHWALQANKIATEDAVIATGSTEARTLPDRFADVVNVKDFGAKGDWVTDDTSAIQAALDKQCMVFFPTGVYRTTHELVMRDGSKIIGSGCFSAQATVALDTGQTVIKYDGPANETIAVLRASKTPVGVDPDDTDSNGIPAGQQSLQNAGAMHITIDGGEKAGFGLYLARAFMQNFWDFITVRATTQHGFWAGKCWQSSPRHWMAWKNSGCGITVGINTFNWTGGAPVDQANFDSIGAYFSGYSNSSSSYTETLVDGSESTYSLGYGIGMGSGRAVTYTNISAAANGGAGIYIRPNAFAPLVINSFYVENNAKALLSKSINQYEIIYVGDGLYTDGPDIRNGRISKSLDGRKAYVLLKGTAPTRKSNPVRFDNIPLFSAIKSDFDNFVLINCDKDVVFEGTHPRRFGDIVNKELNNFVIGTCRFSPNEETVRLDSYSGVILGVEKKDIGTYEITVDDDCSVYRCPIIASSSNNKCASINNTDYNKLTVYIRDVYKNVPSSELTDSFTQCSVVIYSYNV